MGYCGLKSAGCSDTASDFFWSVATSVAKAIKKENPDENGPFNTDGCVNAAYFISEVLYPAAVHGFKNDVGWSFFSNRDMREAVEETQELLKQKIAECDETQKEEWGDEASRLQHFNRYTELAEDIKNYLDHLDNWD